MQKTVRNNAVGALLALVVSTVGTVVAGQGVAGAVEGSWAATGSLNIPRIAHNTRC